MKTVGGLRGQMALLYLAGVVVYCLLSLAVPLGGDALTRWMLAFLNVPGAHFGLVREALELQLLTGLLVPLLAALNAYGLGAGHYGRRLGRVQGLPSSTALALRNTFRRPGRVALTQITLIVAGTEREIFLRGIPADTQFFTP